MSGKHASVFDAETDLDVSGFLPKEAVTPTVRPEEVRAVSEAANFQNREPPREMPAEPPRREPRRYRTGRNIQLRRARPGRASETDGTTRAPVRGSRVGTAPSACRRSIARRPAQSYGRAGGGSLPSPSYGARPWRRCERRGAWDRRRSQAAFWPPCGAAGRRPTALFW
jgi:hypothetical protein